jgi:putative glutathione S-transferase
VSSACPWAHRTIITRKLKGLDDLIGEQNLALCLSGPPILAAPRTLLERSRLKSAHDVLHSGISIVSPRLGQLGWPFASADDFPGAENDPLYNTEHIRDLYFRAQPNYEAR